MPIIGRDKKWQIGPEPEILRGTLGSSAIVIGSDIYLVGGYEPRTERFATYSKLAFLPFSSKLLFCRKPKFWAKIKTLVKNQNVLQKSNRW